MKIPEFIVTYEDQEGDQFLANGQPYYYDKNPKETLVEFSINDCSLALTTPKKIDSDKFVDLFVDIRFFYRIVGRNFKRDTYLESKN